MRHNMLRAKVKVENFYFASPFCRNLEKLRMNHKFQEIAGYLYLGIINKSSNVETPIRILLIHN